MASMERSPGEMLVVALLGMGFDEVAARKAVKIPGVTNVELAINWILSQTEGDEVASDEADDNNFAPMKMIIVVRTDLKMTPGKVAAQACHACLGAYRLSMPKTVQDWTAQGESTICLSVDSDEVLEAVLMSAISAGLIVSAQLDAGRTEVESGTRTCAAIGPDYNRKIDPVTRSLKLYK